MKIEDLKLRKIDVLDNLSLRSASASSGSIGSYNWNINIGSYNWGSGSGYNYGSSTSSGQCRVVESSVAPAIGAAWTTGEIVTAVTRVVGGGALALFAIMLCFTGDTEVYKSDCQGLYVACQHRGGTDSIFQNGQSRCDACRVECLSSRGKTWNCQS